MGRDGLTTMEIKEARGVPRHRVSRHSIKLVILVTRLMHFVYIVRCTDGSLYTGYARDPKARTRAHNSGRGARYTSGRRPVRLVYSEAFETLSEALKREYELKQWTRAEKQDLVKQSRRLARQQRKQQVNKANSGLRVG